MMTFMSFFLAVMLSLAAPLLASAGESDSGCDAQQEKYKTAVAATASQPRLCN